ncbi:MAG: thioredoxin [Armatimonadota bacterium]|nr:thioredoxin [Armatimonadota bacterium]
MAEPVHVDQAAFEVEVLGSDVPVMVDFWAPWCGPCHMVAPTLEQLAADYDGKAKIAKVNVDNNPDLAMKYGIRSIPALLVFKGGEVVDMLIGVQPEDVLRQKLDALV